MHSVNDVTAFSEFDCNGRANLYVWPSVNGTFRHTQHSYSAVVTHRISTAGNAIASVRPFVFPSVCSFISVLSSELSDLELLHVSIGS